MNRKNFLKGIALSAKETVFRFPLTLILSIFVTFLGIYLIGSSEHNNDLTKLMLSSILGISLSIATYIYFERNEFKNSKMISNSIPCVFVISHFLITRTDLSSNYFLKFVQLFVAFHLFISVAAFLFRNETNGFWHFNRILLQRFLFAVFYSSVLFLGLSLAFGFSGYLFDFNFTEKVYLRLWLFCVFVFQIWILLAGIPKDFKILNTLSTYSNGLKVFTQNILVPFVLLYLCILYVYLGKIIVGWNLPKGLVGWMVSSLGLLGVLCLLFIYPIKEKLDTKWTQIFDKYFFYFILPLLGMLFLGLVTRIDEYGFTEKRYFLFVLATWLFIIALYFKISKSSNIKIIPISLFVLSLITLVGPWGAYQVSFRNQSKILKSLLDENNILVGNQIHKGSRETTFEVKKKISSSLDYILENHGIDSLNGFIDKKQLNSFLGGEKNNKFLFNGGHYSEVTESMMMAMGLQYVPKWQREENEQEFVLYSDSDIDAFNLLGYHYLFNFNFNNTNIKNSSFGYTIQANLEKALIEIFQNNILIMTIPLADKINEIHEKKKNNNTIPYQEMVFEFENNQLKVKIYFGNINAYYKKSQIQISHLNGTILLQEIKK